MIEKERLKELIREKATIYFLTLSDVKEVTYNAIPTFWKKHWEDYEDRMYEIKEEAEWELEFGNITRTETLRLPSWEEFNKVGNYFFLSAGYVFYNLNKRGKKLYLRFSFDVDYWQDNDYIRDLTKENYIEACRLCKKLFLGEEV